MRRDRWRRKLIMGGGDKVLASWLREPSSLTARCQLCCDQFRVRLLRAGLMKRMGDVAAGRSLIRGREVVLECDGLPVIFAHSVLLTVTQGRLNRWLAGLGSRSLGSLLFSYPGFKRGGLEFIRLDARHPLYRLAAPWSAGQRQLWARRSEHRLGRQVLCVTEVFLPAICKLEK
ncbi:MAG: chorismate lyase [Rhodocyclaceae bacterium]|nr:chorismate lyase [Rhodocyclaceae bacterium]